MAFTQITITATPDTPAGQPASGTLTATLSEPMQNATELIDPTPISGTFVDGALKDDSGEQPFTLAANDDTGTTPAAPSASYLFVLALDSAPLQQASAVISHLAPGGTVDLTSIF